MHNLFYSDVENDIFPKWMSFDKFNHYIYGNDHNTRIMMNHSCNKYRWNETDNEYKLDIVMPGLRETDIDLKFKDGVLSIKCNKQVSETDQDFYDVKSEQIFKNFPESIDEDNIIAEMDHGILSIRLPKIPSKKAKKITIKEIKHTEPHSNR